MCVMALLSTFLLLGLASDMMTVEAGENVVKAPLVVDLSHAIAGADIAFEYSSGLTFVEYERSEAVKSALLTPVVEKNGTTHLGFYWDSNVYEPQDSKLDMGYLVFEYNGTDAQTVTLTEIKLIEVVDKDTTNSEILAAKVIRIGRAGGGMNPVMWIVIAVVAFIVGIVGYKIKKPKSTPKPPTSEE